MIIDAKPILWTTGALVVLVVGAVGAGVTVAGAVPYASYLAFVLGSLLIWVNLTVGSALVSAASDALAREQAAGLQMGALFGKTLLLFATFAVVGPLVGMVPFVFGIAVTMVCFLTAVVTAPLYSFTPAEAL